MDATEARRGYGDDGDDEEDEDCNNNPHTTWENIPIRALPSYCFALRCLEERDVKDNTLGRTAQCYSSKEGRNACLPSLRVRWFGQPSRRGSFDDLQHVLL